MRTVIIGSGNVATILGEKIYLAEHEVVQVFSRNITNASVLASKIGAAACNNKALLDYTADLYIISVSDSAVAEIAGWLNVKDKIVVHTAGSLSIDLIKNCSTRTGILYPLQTIRKEAVELSEIPILIDGNNQETIDVIYEFAHSLSTNVRVADDDKRLGLHVAAVVVNNFSNYLYMLAAEYCHNENLDFRLLVPLINETGDRLKNFTPMEVQTGPAVRNDRTTIETHLKRLEKYPELVEFYQLFTKKILSFYSKDKS
ncbi:MAG TPA: Rossmann-like and DUF2520 domain-containing protein [Flavitalea sp.]|nr:Rossmann-like and DUF2520 domain-containing protein [Flavitalea sp.]